MKKFFWKMAGADCEILARSGIESQQRFRVIGALYCLVILLIFAAFFGLFHEVFGNYRMPLLCAFILSFLVGNIYRLNMMSLEPPTLRDPDMLKTKVATIVLRFFSIVLFAFFTSKCLETLMFGFLAHDEVVQEMQHLNCDTGGTFFIEHMMALSTRHPLIWIMTASVMYLFLLPVMLKFRLNKRNEYYSLKKSVDIRMVLTHYEEYKALLAQLHRANYERYPQTGDEPVPVYEEHSSQYADGPFNTDRIREELQARSSEDFTHLNWN